MDEVLLARQRAAVKKSRAPAGQGAAAVRGWVELAALSAAMLGGAYLVSFAAARAGLPVSRQVFFEGRWAVDSWRLLPWADLAGMLAFMTALPTARAAARGALRDAGFRFGPRGALWASAGVLILGAAAFSRSAPGEGAALRAVYFAVVAVAEETAFRGTIQRRLSDLVGPAAAIALAAAAFVAWHGFGGGATVIAVRAAAGIGLGLAYYASGSLAAPVAWHWAFNMLVTA